MGNNVTYEELFTIEEGEEEEESEDIEERNEEGVSDSDDETINQNANASSPSTEIMIIIKDRETKEDKFFRVLLDSGTTRCLGTETALTQVGIPIQQGEAHVYHTTAGTFNTTKHASIRAHRLLELSSRRILARVKVQVTDQLGPYDFIFGRDYLTRFGIDLLFSRRVIEWDGISMPMRESGYWSQGRMEATQAAILESYDCNISTNDKCETSYLQEILESHYERQDLNAVALAQLHLTNNQQQQLLQILQSCQDCFSGKLGTWKDAEVSVKLRPDAVPYHCQKPIRVPHIHLGVLKNELDRLVAIRVIKPVSSEEAGPWCAPTFIIPKKDGRVRIITDYRKLNKMILRRPWPMPHIMDMIQDIGTYTFVTALDLSMGYYHLLLSDELSMMSTFMVPGGLYRYLR
jgi:hypothetical protein